MRIESVEANYFISGSVPAPILEAKPKKVKVPLYQDPMHPQRRTGWKIEIRDDGTGGPDTVIQDGKEVPLSNVKPLGLTRPQDVGIPSWQQRGDLGD